MSVIEVLGLGARIRKRVEEGATHPVIVNELKASYPNREQRARSVRGYCKKNNIHRSLRLETSSLDILLTWSI